MTNTTQTRINWNCKGAAGAYHVWHAGKNCYFVTEGRDGDAVAQCDQFGLAFARARRLHEAAKAPH